ncbi:FUSC family protein [Jatrophihabitans sp.]|uniref:FUSC family protein n=1 Tax=Jatrophihabitans sp. TaxID=1932789 RepID=UPI0030C72316|nr:hypothetical protein [Jatrophihabitans sp.]
MTARGASLVALLRDAARLDRTQSDPAVALRNAIGVVAPLIIATLTGSVSAGLASAIGALQTCFADRPGPYRLRIVRMLTTAAAASITSGLAVLASRSDVASAGLLVVLAFGAGLLITGGPSATQVGVAGVGAAIVLGHLPNPPSAALHVGLLVLAGGAGQTLLAVAAWPLGRHRPERLALAGLYRELAAAARLPGRSDTSPAAGATLTAVRQTFYGLGHDHGPSVEAYLVLLAEAERIRREIVVIAGLTERLAAEGEAIDAGLTRAALTGCGDVLDAVARSLAEGRPIDPSVRTPARNRMTAALRRLEDESLTGHVFTRRAAAARLRALAGQLRAVGESSRVGASEGRGLEGQDVRWAARLRDPIEILRANLTPSSAVLRHAVRMALLVGGSDLVVRLAGIGRGYWVPLTILVVLRPDFASTLQRSVMRTLGTIVGLLLASGLVHWVPAGDGYQIALIALFCFGLRLAGPGNLALSAVSLGGLVVILLELNGVAAHSTVLDRSVATLVGGALAIAAALIRPAWEREVMTTRLATLVGVYRDYLAVIADPAAEREALQRMRTAARLARSNAQASVDRARTEPVAVPAEIELGRSVLANSHRFVHALLTVDSVRLRVRDAGGLAELDELLRLAGMALESAEEALRSGQAPRNIPDLRAAQSRLVEVLKTAPERAGGAEAAGALVDASDRMANSLDTLLNELRRSTTAVVEHA